MNSKRLILIASVLMLTIGANAQHEVGSVTFQPKMGMNIATFTDDDDADPRLAFVTGAEFEYQVTKQLSLSAGMLYSQQGAKGKASIDNYAPLEITIKTNYINIPILANVYVAKGLALKLGVQPALNVESGFSMSVSGGRADGSLSDVGIDIKTFDLAIPLGVSYEYRNAVFEGRYNLGVTNIYDIGNSKHSVFQFTLGYKVEL